MNGKFLVAFTGILIAASLYAQKPAENTYLEKINKQLPHKFKELKIGATLEAIREPKLVKLYLIVDDIEQYDQILVERSDEQQKNFSQCKAVTITKGKYPNNYIELVDQYPLSPKMANVYRLKTVDAEGITKMFPPVPVLAVADINLK